MRRWTCWSSSLLLLLASTLAWGDPAQAARDRAPTAREVLAAARLSESASAETGAPPPSESGEDPDGDEEEDGAPRVNHTGTQPRSTISDSSDLQPAAPPPRPAGPPPAAARAPTAREVLAGRFKREAGPETGRMDDAAAARGIGLSMDGFAGYYPRHGEVKVGVALGLGSSAIRPQLQVADNTIGVGLGLKLPLSVFADALSISVGGALSWDTARSEFGGSVYLARLVW